MTLVGPRPERPAFCAEFEKRIPGWHYRTMVTPGLSGLAQVSGGYDLLPKEKVLLDLWRRCAVHLMRGCMREAGSRQLKRRVGRMLSPAFRAKDAATARAMYHVACDMLRDCCPKAAAVAEEAEPDALAYLGFPPSHWKRLRANNVQERANRTLRGFLAGIGLTVHAPAYLSSREAGRDEQCPHLCRYGHRRSASQSQNQRLLVPIILFTV